MAKKLESMEIRFGANGGHSVRHEFARQMVKRGGAMSGGMYSERPPSEEHNFGPEDGEKLISHIRTHLKVGSKGAAEPGEAKEIAKASEPQDY